MILSLPVFSFQIKTEYPEVMAQRPNFHLFANDTFITDADIPGESAMPPQYGPHFVTNIHADIHHRQQGLEQEAKGEQSDNDVLTSYRQKKESPHRIMIPVQKSVFLQIGVEFVIANFLNNARER